MIAVLLAIFLGIFGDATATCANQTATTTPTWGQCIANQFERYTEN